MTKTDYDPDRSLALSHFLTNFLQNLASCHIAFKIKSKMSFRKQGWPLTQQEKIIKADRKTDYANERKLLT
jgi:hypothetical protein